MEMPLTMLGCDYQYAYAPSSNYGLSGGIGPRDLARLQLMGQDTTGAESDSSAAERLFQEALKQGPAWIKAFKGSPEEEKIVGDAGKALGMSWFERNQSLAVAGGVLVLVAVVAVMTTQRRRRRR